MDLCSCERYWLICQGQASSEVGQWWHVPLVPPHFWSGTMLCLHAAGVCAILCWFCLSHFYPSQRNWATDITNIRILRANGKHTHFSYKLVDCDGIRHSAVFSFRIVVLECRYQEDPVSRHLVCRKVSASNEERIWKGIERKLQVCPRQWYKSM